MTNNRLATSVLAILVSASAIFAQSTPVTTSTSGSASAGNARYMPLSQVREGMRGTAMTVFRGTVPEEFNVEILGVVPGGIGPKQDLIVGRISGGSADRTSVFAGMSGSPVYIDGKLVGAISYSFPFSKEPICGITPIEQMIDIFEQKGSAGSASSEPRSFSFADMASATLNSRLPSSTGSGSMVSGVPADSLLMSVAGQTFQPIGTPVTFNGISREVLDRFAPQLMSAGLLPVSAVGGSAPISPMKKADENTLQGGASVSMQLTRGDYTLAAAGTVTMRVGDKIYAFGHPFLSLGTSDLPMSESSVVTVVPNVNNSFKLAVPNAMVGTMTQDRATGVFGKLGQAPRMIPVRLNYRTTRGQTDTMNFEVAKDDFLTPLLLNITIYNTLVAQERSIGDTTILINGEIKVAGREAIKIERRFAGGQASQLAAGSVAVPVQNLLRGRFDDLEISGITLDLQTFDGSKTATLERIAIDRTEVRAGETIEIQAFARTDSGRIFVQRIPVLIPAGTTPGQLTIKIGDGAAIQKDEAIQHFVPNDLTDLVETMNLIKTPDRLYVRVFRTSTGAIIGSNELPNLPPSMLATLNTDRTTGGIKPATQTVVTEFGIAPAEFLISGGKRLEITVIK